VTTDVVSLDNQDVRLPLNSGVRVILRACRLTVACALVAVPLASGCSDDTPTAPSHFAPYSQTDIRLGSGADAVNGSVVSVAYTGWLYNELQPEQKGAQFDSSVGGDPFEFTLGAGQVVEGFDRGIVGMKVGGLRRLVIPPSLGYGEVRNGSIPPNATLVFEVELVEVR
jgi:FKBP-type peptidyl-prolyl cis-trans isomerase FkpA